jgi:hypothetical protein
VEQVEHKIERMPKRGDEHWVWGEVTETVACTLLLCVSVPVLVVMLAWMIHQLAAMGV